MMKHGKTIRRTKEERAGGQWARYHLLCLSDTWNYQVEPCELKEHTVCKIDSAPQKHFHSSILWPELLAPWFPCLMESTPRQDRPSMGPQSRVSSTCLSVHYSLAAEKTESSVSSEVLGTVAAPDPSASGGWGTDYKLKSSLSQNKIQRLGMQWCGTPGFSPQFQTHKTEHCKIYSLLMCRILWGSLQEN